MTADSYLPPRRAMDLALDVAGLAETLVLPPFEQFGGGDVEGVLDGFGRLAADVLAPTDRLGDRMGIDFDPSTGQVTIPAPLRAAHRSWTAGGWPTLTAPPEHGGGGLPALVGTAVEEMFAAANLALSLSSMLTQGAIHLLDRWADPAQRTRYLPRLVAGEWTGTMCLTEPDAGSDLGGIRTKAMPRPDGRWELTGTKIFVTWGEHDLADNIVHLVLARAPGAPAGVKGISLFVVPRHVVGPDGSRGDRNRVSCTRVESKLGLHASPTCVLELAGAIGELVGPEGGGMAAMFTMMNAARLSVGVEGLAVAERAYQQALAHARQRLQGRGPGASSGRVVPIIEHPDVARMLLLMASGIDAMRLLLYVTAAATDRARHHPDPHRREAAAARVGLLTPLAKAWCTDEGVRISSLALQVHGGMGFIEETGVAQRYRDSRVMPIYEGTNGIQAIDLLERKVRRDGGSALGCLLEELEPDVAALGARPETERAAAVLAGAIRSLEQATDWVMAGDERDRLAAAGPYLDLAALAVCGGLLARQANRARSLASVGDPAEVRGRAAFFALERVTHAPALLETITAGHARLGSLAGG